MEITQQPYDFSDLEGFQALPRLSSLALSPDGTRLVTSVATLDPKKQKWVNAIHEIDPTGARPSRRLTRSAKGEGSPAFTDAGDLLFTSGRPDVTTEDDDEPAALWLLPAGGGEAQRVGTRPGGLDGPVSRGNVVVAISDTLPGATDGEDDKTRREARKERKVSGVLHAGYPVRYWDHDLGPGEPRLLIGDLPAEADVEWRDLTPAPGRALDHTHYDISPEGSRVVATWDIPEPKGSVRSIVVLIDTASGERTVLADDELYEFHGVVLSPDGTKVATVRSTRSTPHDPGNEQLLVLSLDGGAEQVIGDWDRWPTGVQWAPEGDALIVTADDQGRSPVFRVELADGSVTRLTLDDAAYTDVQVARDGSAGYALQASYLSPARPVRFDLRVPGTPIVLPSPVPDLALPGSLTEVTTTSADGRDLRAWLVLPEGDGPHPTVLWIHGGPLGSWNAWSWRWCPWLLAARGYAVLLPDPALSTGYGLGQIRAGWGDWGGAPYEDLMRMTDVALERPDLDAARTGAMGGSFGGYMANWVAGHTDRFRAIVTHASLWALDQFGPTTDAAWYWSREMTPEMVEKSDPSRHIDNIVTPMLVIHGDKDYRVPIGEGLRLWQELNARADDPATMPHRFLYFPDENHWVLHPGNAQVWYETVLAFLGQHVLGDDEQVPDLLR
ncbi:MAG: WD40-like beta Propeller containing protein [Frankiales bacterium]|nr:WD40-like beta Propeller containing protein [Frankiales bacterium]